MTIRRDLAEKLPNQSHSFNADVLTKKFTPAGPDHAQVAACAGMVDYADELYTHHFKNDAAPTARGRAVHDLAKSYEERLS